MNSGFEDSKKIVDVEYDDVNNEDDRIIRGEPLFYTTTQTAEIVGVEPSTIRYWSKRFENLLDIEISNRNKQYKKIDIEKLKIIKKLAYEDGLTLQQIEDYCNTKGFDIKSIEKSTVDGSNPLPIQAFTTAVMAEVDKKFDTIMEKLDDSHKKYLISQQEMNDKLQENIVTTVDEVVCEKLEENNQKIRVMFDKKELDAKQRDTEMIDLLKNNMKERQERFEEENKKSKGFWSKIFNRK